MAGPEKAGEASVGANGAADNFPFPNSKGKESGPALAQMTSTATASSGPNNKIELVHLEDIQTGQQKLGWKKKLQRHWARFWACYVVGGIVFLAIFLPLLFLKIIPALAQLIVNKTDLPIYSATLKARNNNEVAIGLETALDVPAGLTVKLDPLQLWLYNKDTPEFSPYTMVPLDSQTVKGHTEITVQDTVVEVGNRSELHTWLTQMLYQKQADISVRGNTTAHLGELHFGTNLDKTVSIDALDELNGFQLVDSSLKLPADEDGTNLVGNLTLPNWSKLTIGLGNLTFNAWAGDLLIGSVSVDDVLLQPKANATLPFKGEIFITTLLENIVGVLSSQAQALTSGAIEIGISGNKTIIDGEHITYLEGVLNEAHILSQIPIIQLLTDLLQSVMNGDIDLGGLVDVLVDGLGPLMDGLFGGSDDGDNPLADILGGLNITSTQAKSRLGTILRTGKANWSA